MQRLIKLKFIYFVISLKILKSPTDLGFDLK